MTRQKSFQSYYSDKCSVISSKYPFYLLLTTEHFTTYFSALPTYS